jgi:hypothetical protein
MSSGLPTDDFGARSSNSRAQMRVERAFRNACEFDWEMKDIHE